MKKLKIGALSFFTSFFGVGLIPWAPGTMGSLAALPLVYVLFLLDKFYGYLIALCLLSLIALWTIGLQEKGDGEHDSSRVVIDEVVGILVTFLFIPLTLPTLLMGFVLFRFFDILKPFPINFIDQKVPGSLGVLGDDILAGLFSNLILHWILTQSF